MRFTKMQGAGNDYVYVNCFDQPLPEQPAELAKKISDRHFGVGGDGLILICPSTRGRRPDEDVQRRRLGGGDVRQRRPLRGQVRLRPRHLAAAERCGSRPAAACSAWSWRSPAKRSAACGSIWASRSSIRPESPSTLPRPLAADRIVDFPAERVPSVGLPPASWMDGLRMGLADDVRFDGQSARRHVLPTRGVGSAGVAGAALRAAADLPQTDQRPFRRRSNRRAK